MTRPARPAAPDVRTREGLEAVLTVAREAAREAGALALAGFRTEMLVEHKGAVDLVTRFDRDSEALLRERLGSALSFPIVGEEQGGSGAGSDVEFFVDPIDGTTNFVHGHPFWCVSIGLVAEGRPVLGVVLSPPLGCEWFGWIAPTGDRRASRRTVDLGVALTSDGALAPPIREERCRVSTTSALEDAALATGFPYDRRTSPDPNFAEFVAMKLRCQAIRRCGSAALDLCLVADGTYDGYWEKRLSPWDIAAGTALVRAAGGRVTDLESGADAVANGSLIATNGSLHEALSEALAEVRRARADLPR